MVWSVAVPLGLAALVLLALLAPGFNGGPLGSDVVAGSTGTRAALWRDGLSLARDYRFTGVGFGATMMALSTYVYLLHVGYVGHVHNFLLELTIEQGLLGVGGLWLSRNLGGVGPGECLPHAQCTALAGWRNCGLAGGDVGPWPV